jgi:hypothetical protein
MEPALEGYVPLASRSTWAQRALIAVVALNAVAAASAYFAYRLYQHDVVTQDELDTTDLREGLVALLEVAAYVFAVVFFIRWFHRAYRNLPALRATRLRYRTWWTIGGWFIPIVGLFRPKQIANDIWRGSDPDGPPAGDPYDWRRAHVPPLFQWWWAFYIVGTWLENIAFRADVNANDLDAYGNVAVLNMVTDSINIVGGVLAVLVVRRTTMRLEARATRLAAAGSPETNAG